MRQAGARLGWYAVGGIVTLLLVGGALGATPKAPSTPIAPQLDVDVPGLSLWWTGNAGWLVRSKDVLIGFDLVLEKEPFLDEFSMDVRYERPIRAAQLGELKYSFVSHAHGDHFARETTKVLLRESRCRFVLPRSCLKVADELGIPADRRIVAVPGETLQLEGLTVRPIHAIHGDRFGAVYDEANLDDAGYVVDLDGRRIFHPGDSILQQRQLALKDIDVLLVSVTEHNTWIENSVRLIEALRPRLALPMHYDTYTLDIFWTIGYPREVRERLPADLRARFRPVRQGERVVLGPGKWGAREDRPVSRGESRAASDRREHSTVPSPEGSLGRPEPNLPGASGGQARLVLADELHDHRGFLLSLRGHERTMRTSLGNWSIWRFSPLPWESATTISVAPASRAAATAARASPVMNSRKRPYSKPAGPS